MLKIGKHTNPKAALSCRNQRIGEVQSVESQGESQTGGRQTLREKQTDEKKRKKKGLKNEDHEGLKTGHDIPPYCPSSAGSVNR